MTLSATAWPTFDRTFQGGHVRDEMTVLGTVALDNNGVATYTTSSLAVGTHSLQASLVW